MLEWLFPTFTSCVVCGREDTSSVTCGVCKDCYNKLPWCSSASSIFVYTVPIVDLIHQLKYDNKRYLAKVLIALGREKISTLDYDIICFVPSFDKRRRGYVQAECIARAIDSKRTVDALKKIKDIPSQTDLDAAQRMENVKGAFTVSNPEFIEQKRILLVDDVHTTGATISECKKVLLSAGANRVQIFTICIT